MRVCAGEREERSTKTICTGEGEDYTRRTMERRRREECTIWAGGREAEGETGEERGQTFIVETVDVQRRYSGGEVGGDG